MSRRDVAVLGGGRSSEHDVSLASAAAVTAALDRDRYRVHPFTIERDGWWSTPGRAAMPAAQAMTELAACDVAIPMLHGPHGEDGTVAGLLELLGVPSAGSGVRAGAIAMDKWAAKLVAEALGIPTAPGVVVGAVEPVAWSGPVVVKPVASGSSHGVTLVRRPEDLAAAIELALTLDDRALVERFIVGREVDVAVLVTPDGATAPAPTLEIVRDGIFDADAKYRDPHFVIPAPLDAQHERWLRTYAVRLAEALGCRGLVRVDFFVTDDGPVFNELNTAPGFTEHSQVPRMFAAAGVSYPELLDLLIATALAAAVDDGAPSPSLGMGRPTAEVPR